MKIQILDRTKKKKITEELKPLGIKKINHLLVKVGKERIKAYSGSLSSEEIYDVWRILPIEGIGLYLAKEIIDKKSGKREVRLSIDGAHALHDSINDRIIELSSEQEELWFQGKEIELTSLQKESITFEKCFVVVISKDSQDIIGTGKIGANKEIVYNYLPKERRRKKNLL
jgi:NOL1/NOP2/fmu family ribosome biogenesis protein